MPVSRALALLVCVASLACHAPIPAPRAGSVDLLSERHGPILSRETTLLYAGHPALFAGFHKPEKMVDGSSLVWMSEEGWIAFDLASAEPRGFAIEAQAFHEPRELRVAVDGVEQLARVETSWRMIELPLPTVALTPGRHSLRLRAHAERPRDVDPQSGDARPLSIAIRTIQLLPPMPDPAATAERTARGVWLPPGTAASWTIAPQPFVREVRFDASGPVRFCSDGRVGEGPPPSIAAGVVARWAAFVPAGAEAAGTIARLDLVPAPGASPLRSEPPAASSVAIVVGALDDGQVLVPCSTDPDRSLACLLTGLEAAAFGYAGDPGWDLVTHDPDEAAELLERRHQDGRAAVVVLLAGDGAVAPVREALRRRVGAFTQLVGVSLAGQEDRHRGRVISDAGVEPGARDLDLLRWARGVAGRPLPGRPVTTALAAGGIAQRDGDRDVVVTASEVLDVSSPSPNPAALEPRHRDMLTAARQRRRDHEWLAP